jgi:rSAM/selenodomain-associated transferase 2
LAPLSVIIPTLNAASGLPSTFAALYEGVQEGLIAELIVSDGGSGDDTLLLSDEVGAVILRGEAGRGAQLRRGGEAGKGAWMLFLHADTVLPVGWTQLVRTHMQSGDGAACFKLSFDDESSAAGRVAGWANLRTKYLSLPYGDQGLLVSRRLYKDVGGYPDQPLMEDVAIARKLRGKITVLPGTVRTSAARYTAQGWVKRGWRNLTLLVRYLMGADPEKLASAYRR